MRSPRGPFPLPPSPTTQAKIKSGFVERGPEGMVSEYPNSRPSWIDPGVVAQHGWRSRGERDDLKQTLEPGLVLG